MYASQFNNFLGKVLGKLLILVRQRKT